MEVLIGCIHSVATEKGMPLTDIELNLSESPPRQLCATLLSATRGTARVA